MTGKLFKYIPLLAYNSCADIVSIFKKLVGKNHSINYFFLVNFFEKKIWKIKKLMEKTWINGPRNWNLDVHIYVDKWEFYSKFFSGVPKSILMNSKC